MDRRDMIFLGFYLVPSLSLFLSILGYLEGGLGSRYLDYLFYGLEISLAYTIIHCFGILYPKRSWKYLASCVYILTLILVRSYLLNFLYWPCILFGQLILFNSNRTVDKYEIDLSKSILYTSYTSIAPLNKVMLMITYVLIILYVLLTANRA